MYSGKHGKSSLKADMPYKVIALAGNPNVGKSTLFNSLTGMKQHTGNWPGKTVANAYGYCYTTAHSYRVTDIPGTYSLSTKSEEEKVARDFVCSGDADIIIAVCSATCLERNLNLVLQILEISRNVVLCVNFLDEAEKRHISVNLPLLSEILGIPVVGTASNDKKSAGRLLETCDAFLESRLPHDGFSVKYEDIIENAINDVKADVAVRMEKCRRTDLECRWLSIRLLMGEAGFQNLCFTGSTKSVSAGSVQDTGSVQGTGTGLGISDGLADMVTEVPDELAGVVSEALDELKNKGISRELLGDKIVSTLVITAEEISKKVVAAAQNEVSHFDRRVDRFMTGKFSGHFVMLLLLALIFWITVSGANYISDFIAYILFRGQDLLSLFIHGIGMPDRIHNLVVYGVYRVTAWVISVMLPPMSIFFPLFALLEESGYLPRVAYNLDKTFKRCNSCGKQALTMSMGFGCNAAGVVGCRIIDSPRERLLAVLTNNFVPCNGRFPALIAILTMFFIGTSAGLVSSVFSALLLTVVILTGIIVTFLVTRILSVTVLKGALSTFVLELPPYRLPKFGSVVMRSLRDRALFVLIRAVLVAVPAGAVIWIMANINIGETSLLYCCAQFLDPLAKLMGLDGFILIAFILGFPANEIVLPILMMAYLAQSSLPEIGNLGIMQQILAENGWTWITAISFLIFSLMHWPCSTTLLTIFKETYSAKWTLLAAFVPSICGITLCIIFSNTAKAVVSLIAG